MLLKALKLITNNYTNVCSAKTSNFAASSAGFVESGSFNYACFYKANCSPDY